MFENKPKKKKIHNVQVSSDDMGQFLIDVYKKFPNPAIYILRQTAYWFQVIIVEK